MADVVSYKDKNYQMKKALYDVIAQCIEDVKYGTVHTNNAWNMPVEQVKGVTARLLGEGHLELIYHRYETTTVEGLARDEIDQNAKTFIKEVLKEVKKAFKKRTGKALTLKEVKSDRGVEKVSRLISDTSWILGYGRKPFGRFLVKDSFVYEISANL